MEKISISAVVLCKDEETILDKCLKSLSFCTEIIIIDDFSQDNFEKIANKYKAQIYKKSLGEDFASQRNFGLEKAKHEWILFVDADEIVSPQLAEEITNLLSTNILFNAFYIRRRDFFWNTELQYGELETARTTGFIRLVKKGRGSWRGKVHEVFITEGNVGKLNHLLAHYPHQTVTEFLRSVNTYSSLRAKELFETGKKTNFLEIILYPLGKFIWTYLIKGGFRDGSAGFAYSFFMSFHSFLVRAKLYQYSEIDKK